MRYYVTLSSAADAKPVAVDVNALPSGALAVKLDDQPVDVDVMTLGATTLAVLDDHRRLRRPSSTSPSKARRPTSA